MIFGGSSGLGQGVTPRVVAVIGKRDIEAAEALLVTLAERTRGTSLSYWEKRKVRAMAPAVAMRRKRNLRPVLTQEQAGELWAIASGATD